MQFYYKNFVCNLNNKSFVVRIEAFTCPAIQKFTLLDQLIKYWLILTIAAPELNGVSKLENEFHEAELRIQQSFNCYESVLPYKWYEYNCILLQFEYFKYELNFKL